MFTAWILLMLNSLFFTLRLSGGGSGSFPRPLKAEEERMYLERMAQGDLEARNILIEHNLRLVAHIMKKYYTPNGDQDDLISIGTIGLIKDQYLQAGQERAPGHLCLPLYRKRDPDALPRPAEAAGGGLPVGFH